MATTIKQNYKINLQSLFTITSLATKYIFI